MKDVHVYTRIHCYIFTYTLVHSHTPVDRYRRTHTYIEEKKTMYRSYLKMYLTFLSLYFTCDRDFIKRVKIFSARARRLSLVCEFFFFLFKEHRYLSGASYNISFFSLFISFSFFFFLFENVPVKCINIMLHFVRNTRNLPSFFILWEYLTTIYSR